MKKNTKNPCFRFRGAADRDWKTHPDFLEVKRIPTFTRIFHAECVRGVARTECGLMVLAAIEWL